MSNRVNQVYEEYWSYTAAYTDMNGEKFLSVLRNCIDFINNQNDTSYSEKKYEQLQKIVSKKTGITLPSVRKAINQLVKLGFLKPLLQGYVPEALEYTNAKTDKKRQALLSKIVYHHCNFDNAMTQQSSLGLGQIKFFLKTLTEVGSINDKSLTALMSVNINDYAKGFLNQTELNTIFSKAFSNGFIDRKYNQISHLKNLLCRLNDLQERNNVIYFKTDADRLFGDDEELRTSIRDSYLQRIYKAELEEESTSIFYDNNDKDKRPKCMVEELSHPVLIASHIKPYKLCSEQEAFDPNNGLLLSRSTDSLFDLGYITFNDDGNVIPSKILGQDISDYLSKMHLNKGFINKKRMEFMDFHRKYVFGKKFSLDVFKKYNSSQAVITAIAADRVGTYNV